MKEDTTNKMNEGFFRKLPGNFSRLIIPFHVEDNGGRLARKLFSSGKWIRFERDNVYLTEYMSEIFGGKNGDICSFFLLDREAREKAGLPPCKQMVQVVSEIKNDTTEKYTFSMEYIWAAYFATGMGFFMIDVGHYDAETVKEITDKCFVLVNSFNIKNNRESGENAVRFYYTCGESMVECKIKDAVESILEVPEHDGAVRLIPNNKRGKLNAYHRLYRDKVSEEDSKYAGFMARGMFSGAVMQEELFEDEFSYNSNNNMSWDISSIAAVALTENVKGKEVFIKKSHLMHVERDYFLVYLFGLHEREILLWYNQQIVSNWNKGGKLIKYKDELMRFNIWFSYNTISCEMSYQKFYDCLYKALNIENLERDVQEVVTKVSEYESGIRSDRLNIFLTMITCITTVSVFGEIIDFIRWVIGEENSRIAEILGVIVVAVAVVLTVAYIIVKEKRKRTGKNKWMRRKKQQ